MEGCLFRQDTTFDFWMDGDSPRSLHDSKMRVGLNVKWSSLLPDFNQNFNT